MGHRGVARKHPALQYNDVEFIYSVTNSDGTTERHVDALPWRYYFRFELEHRYDVISGLFQQAPEGGAPGRKQIPIVYTMS